MLVRGIVLSLVLLFLAAFAYVVLRTPGFDLGLYFAKLDADETNKGTLIRNVLIISAFGAAAFKAWLRRRNTAKPLPKRKREMDLEGL